MSTFRVADVTTPLVAVGELQKRGMIVVMGPHGNFVTRGQVMKPPGSNLDLEHSNGAYWMRLTRGESGTSTVCRPGRCRARIERPGLAPVNNRRCKGRTQKQTCPRR